MQGSAQLQEENTALKTRIEDLEEQVRELEALKKYYEDLFKLSQKKRFGTSSEQGKYNGVEEQLSLFNDVEAEYNACKSEQTITVAAHERKKAARGANYEDLEEEVIVHTLPEAERICPQCGEHLHVMKTEEHKEIDIIPARVTVKRHVTEYYSCRNCQKNGTATPIIAAEAPKALIPRSMASPSALAYLMNQKYCCGMPLYRMEQDFMRMGLVFPRQTMSNWIIAGAALLDSLSRELKQELLRNSVLMADETTVQVLHEPGKTPQNKSYMWLYRTSEYAEHPVVLYDYQPGRNGEYAKEFLSGFQGKLIVDGYQGYNKLEPDVTLCGCWSHMKRYFDDALAVQKQKTENLPEAQGIAYCQALSSIEKEARRRKLDPEERLRLRENKSRPIAEEFFDWVTMLAPKVLPESMLGKALTYAKNQRPKLLQFLQDGRVELDNNRSERSIKMFVMGRKAWLFCDTQNGARTSASLYGIIQTAIENRLKPLPYLQYVFETIRQDGMLMVEKALPWSSAIPDVCRMSEKEIARYEKKQQH